MKLIFFIVVIAMLLSACAPPVVYVALNGGVEFEQERSFLISLFEEDKEIAALGLRLLPEETATQAEAAAIFVDFVSLWEYECENDGTIIISGNFFVPKEDPLLARTNTDLAACLDGTETLVLIEEIAPPFTALRVDSLAVGDEGYPLVRLTGIKINAAEGIKITKRLKNKIRQLTEVLENASKPLIRPMPEPLWIAAGGDLMLDNITLDILLRDGPRAVFGGTAEMLASSDLALVNLEGVISNRGKKITETKSFAFRFNPEIAPALRAAGIDAVLHANNHVYDFGEDAFLDSLSYLEKTGIGITGAGRNIEAASEPFVFQKGNETCYVFGLASFPRERNGWDGETAAALEDRPGMLHARRCGREKLKEKFLKDGMNIVLFHGGVEASCRPDAYTRELYNDLIASGADLVIGSHPHTVQGFEWVQGKPVFWSLGNYVFGGAENTDGYEEGLFICLGFFNGKLLYMEPYALTHTRTGTDIASKEALEIFYRRSRELAR